MRPRVNNNNNNNNNKHASAARFLEFSLVLVWSGDAFPEERKMVRLKEKRKLHKVLSMRFNTPCTSLTLYPAIIPHLRLG